MFKIIIFIFIIASLSFFSFSTNAQLPTASPTPESETPSKDPPKQPDTSAEQKAVTEKEAELKKLNDELAIIQKDYDSYNCSSNPGSTTCIGLAAKLDSKKKEVANAQKELDAAKKALEAAGGDPGAKDPDPGAKDPDPGAKDPDSKGGVQGQLFDNPLGVTDVPTIVGRIIKAVLGIVGSIALVMFIYGGIIWMTAAGNQERVKKGGDVLIWASVGLVIIFGSYGIVKLILDNLLPS